MRVAATAIAAALAARSAAASCCWRDIAVTKVSMLVEIASNFGSNFLVTSSIKGGRGGPLNGRGRYCAPWANSDRKVAHSALFEATSFCSRSKYHSSKARPREACVSSKSMRLAPSRESSSRAIDRECEHPAQILQILLVFRLIAFFNVEDAHRGRIKGNERIPFVQSIYGVGVVQSDIKKWSVVDRLIWCEGHYFETGRQLSSRIPVHSYEKVERRCSTIRCDLKQVRHKTAAGSFDNSGGYFILPVGITTKKTV